MDAAMDGDQERSRTGGRDRARPVRRRLLLDPESHVGFLVVSLANRISASASRAYMRDFDVGVMEWRVIALLAAIPGITANEIGQTSGVDKSSVSRATHALIHRGFVQARDDEFDNRRTLLFLTPEGFAVHDRLIVASLAREERLLEGFSPKEKADFVKFLKQATANLPLVNAFVPAKLEDRKRRRPAPDRRR
jgi:DNA-binding MarR family transcriptional regulator